MSGFNNLEAANLLNDQSLIDEAICNIFDRIVATADVKSWARMKNTYPREYLDSVLGGYPEYLDDSNELGDM